MSNYMLQKISLTPGQKQKFQKHYAAKMPLKIKLKLNQLSGGDDNVFLTNRQINHLKKARDSGRGAQIDFSHAQIVKQSGGFLGAILPMAKTMAIPLAKKVAGPLLTGTLSGLMSSLMHSITGKGLFSVPQDKVNKLIKYKDYLTKAQKEQIVTALQQGKGVVLSPTQKQTGGLFPLLAGLAASMVLPKLLSGRGLQIDANQRGSRKIFIPKKDGGDIGLVRWLTKLHGGFIFPPSLQRQFDEQFYKKNFRAKGLILGPNSPLKGIPLLGDIF